MKTKNRQSGVALVEFALVLPLLLLMTFVVTEYSRALYQYNTLTKSVRDAARYLSMQDPGTRIAQAKNLVVYGNPAGSGHAAGDRFDDEPGAGSGMALRRHVAGDQHRHHQNNRLHIHSDCSHECLAVNFGNITYADISATMRAPL